MFEAAPNPSQGVLSQVELLQGLGQHLILDQLNLVCTKLENAQSLQLSQPDDRIELGNLVAGQVELFKRFLQAAEVCFSNSIKAGIKVGQL